MLNVYQVVRFGGGYIVCWMLVREAENRTAGILK